MSQSRDIDPIRIFWMNSDSADRLGLFESYVFPVLPSVFLAIDAIPLQYVMAELHLTHAQVDNIRIRF